jgi:peptidoglycan/LPS O-acetylase OafA/YrhL
VRAVTSWGAEKDAGIESLRGIAVLLMVAGHVIGSDTGSGLRVPDDSTWRYAYYTLAPIRMPLFMAISGFVYALRPATGATWSRFMAGKVRRLCIPLLVIGSAFVTIQMITPGVNAQLAPRDLPRLLVIPYAHFWYLYALAWAFLVVGALDARGLLEDRWQWMLLLATSFALRASGLLATPVLGIWHAQLLLPYFVLGLGIRRFSVRRGRPLAIALLGFGAAGMVLYQGCWFGWQQLGDVGQYVVRSVVSAVAVIGCLTYRVSWTPLAMLGPFSYGIYLMHLFGTAGARILLQEAGVESLPVLALAGLLAGIAVPIAVERAIRHNRWLVLFVLGQRAPASEAELPPDSRRAAA